MRIRVPSRVPDVLTKEEVERILPIVEALFELPARDRLEISTNSSLPPEIVRIVALTLVALKPEGKFIAYKFQPIPKKDWVTFFDVTPVGLDELLEAIDEQKRYIVETEGRYILNPPIDNLKPLKVLAAEKIPELWKADLPYETYKYVALLTWPIIFPKGHIQAFDPFIFPTEYNLLPEKWYSYRNWFSGIQGGANRGYATSGDLSTLDYYLSTKERQPYSDAVIAALYASYSPDKFVEAEAVLALELKTMFSEILELPPTVARELWQAVPKVSRITYRMWNGWDILFFPSGLFVVGKLRSVEQVLYELSKVYKMYPKLLRAPVSYKDLPGIPVVGIPGSFMHSLKIRGGVV